MALTNSVLPFVLEKASNIWPGSMTEVDFKPTYDILNAVTAQQTAQISFANLPEGADAKISWLNNCDLAVADCADDCDFTGESVDSYVKDLEISRCKQVTFSEPIDNWENNMFGLADALAVNLNKAMKVQLEEAAKYVVAQLNAFAGTNTYTNQGEFTVSGTTTSVPGVSMDNTGIFGKLRRTAIKNRIDMPYLITGDNLDQMIYMAKTSSANGEGKGDNTRIAEMPVYSDLFNIDAVNTDDLVTYMINRGATAFVSKARWSERPQELGGGATVRFSISNRFFPALKHDVEMQEKCAGGVWKIHYRVKAKYDFFLNPTGCTAGRTGVLKFVNAGGLS